MRVLPIRRCLAPTVLTLLALAALVAPAEAQLGALRRAAERRVERKAEDRMAEASLIAPTFDETTIEITAERLDRFTTALEARRVAREKNRAAFEAAMDRVRAINDSASASDNPRESDAHAKATGRYLDCRGDVRSGIEAEQASRQQALVQKMQTNPVAAQSDPEVKRFSAAMQEIAQAQQRNDQVALKAAMLRFQTLMGGATDSASLDKASVGKCGARPAKPLSMVRTEALKERANKLEADTRAMMGASARIKGATVGMTDEQAAMYCERIASWLAGMRNDAPITRTFSKAEYDLLVSRRSDLRKPPWPCNE